MWADRHVLCVTRTFEFAHTGTILVTGTILATDTILATGTILALAHIWTLAHIESSLDEKIYSTSTGSRRTDFNCPALAHAVQTLINTGTD